MPDTPARPARALVPARWLLALLLLLGFGAMHVLVAGIGAHAVTPAGVVHVPGASPAAALVGPATEHVVHPREHRGVARSGRHDSPHVMTDCMLFVVAGAALLVVLVAAAARRALRRSYRVPPGWWGRRRVVAVAPLRGPPPWQRARLSLCVIRV